MIGMEDLGVQWSVRAIRGATTVSENTVAAIREAVTELLDEVEARNQISPTQYISVTFSVTRDLTAIFPAAIARERSPLWEDIALLDVQQMHVEGSLNRCIRVLIHVTLPDPDRPVYHPYLRQAQHLRPDRNQLTTERLPSPSGAPGH